ncbi:MAG: cytochrome c oxidase subunit II, partial [Mesorhizobium sp.]
MMTAMRKFLAGAKFLISAWAAATLFGASAHAAQPAPWEVTFQP